MMAGAPALARLPNAEKQQMHDWLVCRASRSGGLTLKI